MIRYHVMYDDKVIKQLKKIDKSQRDMLIKWIKKNLDNTDNPRKNGKQLKGNLNTS